MKIAGPQYAGILRDLGGLAGILLHGDDSGLVRDRARLATQAVIGPVTDPFRETVLTREEHKALRDAATSLSLGGGRRVVRVLDGVDGLTPVLETLAEHRADALIIIESGALTPRSKLRNFAEKHTGWASMACYPASGRAVSEEISRELSANGLQIAGDALAYLAVELAGDTNRRRAELEKLVLFAAGCGQVTLDMAQGCCASSLDASLGSAISAAMLGRSGQCDALLEELGREGATGPGILAVLSNQVHRLLKVRLQMDAGAGAEEACRRLQPPVFPQQMPGFLHEVQRWPAASLEALGQAIREADIACKRAGSADFAIAGRLLTIVAGRRA